MVLVEMWLNPVEADNVIPINELSTRGYSFKFFARDGRGGGVGVLLKQPL